MTDEEIHAVQRRLSKVESRLDTFENRLEHHVDQMLTAGDIESEESRISSEVESILDAREVETDEEALTAIQDEVAELRDLVGDIDRWKEARRKQRQSTETETRSGGGRWEATFDAALEPGEARDIADLQNAVITSPKNQVETEATAKKKVKLAKRMGLFSINRSGKFVYCPDR
jgi:DNA repair exonuclease SbcCD ATPase subunit